MAEWRTSASKRARSNSGSNSPFGWSPGRWAERVAGVDAPFAVSFGEHKARAFRVGESRRRRVAVDVEVERGVGRARQRVRVETRPALFQYLLALCASRTAGELGAGL